jgi:DNA-binding NtrC family response regulator
MNTQTSPNIPHPAEKPAHLSVLVVDDEPLIRWSLREGLIDRGHQVATAATATDALAEIRSATRAFDVAILDYRLPDRQDLTLLDDVRRLSPATIVVMMTAFGEDTMRTGAQARGARAVVDKPFQVKTFVSLVESEAAR